MIPIGKYKTTDYTKQLVTEVLDTGNLVQGKLVQRFEEEFAEISGAKYAVAMCNGTISLTLMLKAFNVNTVVTNPLSFVATRNAIRHARHEPYFSDVDYETGNLLQRDYKHKLLMPVDLHGIRDPLKGGETNYILRDSSQAHGQQLQPTDTAMSFSFHASKNATSGEGGMIVTDNESLVEELRLLRNHGTDEEKGFFLPGAYNARMTDLQAAVGIGSIRQLKETNITRTSNAAYYDQNLNKIKSLKLPAKQDIYHHYILRHDKADEIVKILREKEIDARKYYKKLINYDLDRTDYPLSNAQKICDESFAIPVHQHLTDQEKEFILETVITTVEYLDEK
jgi:perosamine synthetase